MITINTILLAGHSFARDTVLNGMVTGDATVPTGRHVEINGTIAGTLRVEQAASVDVNGTVTGMLINDGGKVVVRGVIGGLSDLGTIKTVVQPGAVVRA